MLWVGDWAEDESAVARAASSGDKGRREGVCMLL